MKKWISLILIGSCLFQPVALVRAQGGQSAVKTANLSPAIKAIIENVKSECGLNPNQSTKFTNDYVSFLDDNAKNLSVNAADPPKRDAETKRLLLQAGAHFRSYLNDGQFTKLTQMIQAGKLDPAKQSGGSAAANSAIKTAPVQNGGAKQVPPPASLPSIGITSSNVSGLFEQLTPFMKVTPAQSAKVLPVLRDYDQKVTSIKNQNAGNNGKIQSELSALNTKTVDMLKPMLNSDQLGKLILANTMQENIISGKNLNADQKTFLEKLRSQYNLNDVQLMSVVLVMVQGKIRGDMINQMAKTNPQGAAQELGNLLQDLDGQLKSSLSGDQYTKVKSDIEKLVKGQHI